MRDSLERGGYVIIANHVSYVDGIVLGSIFPILFVSKREVKKWPIVGQWNVLCGTVFVNRQRKATGGRVDRRADVQIKAEVKHPPVPGRHVDQRRTNAAVPNRASGGAAAQPLDHRAGDDRL